MRIAKKRVVEIIRELADGFFTEQDIISIYKIDRRVLNKIKQLKVEELCKSLPE